MTPQPYPSPPEAEEHLLEETLVVLALEGLSAFPEADRAAIHAHLDVCEECRGALAEVRRGEEPEPTPEPGRMRLFEPRTLVAGRYKIVRYINGGGMGDVYEAQDTRVADTTIALKTISAVAADEESAIRRLEREVRTALLVSHAHACRVHHLDVHRLPGDQGTIHFITMELIDGETLAERIKRSGPLPEASALELSQQLLGALTAAHCKGVLHRDLKPSNVMLRRGDKVDGVVMDFGLAKTLEEPVDARITDSRAFVGSAGYAAPEQLIGDPLTAATDVYAFGVVLFEALTGRLPFEDQGAMRSALRRLEQRAPRLTRVAPHLSSGWDRVVGRCLERDPKRRYASAAEVERALHCLRLGPRNSPNVRMAVGLGSLLAIGGVGTALLSWAPSPSPPSSLPGRNAGDRQLVEPRPADAIEHAVPALAPRGGSNQSIAPGEQLPPPAPTLPSKGQPAPSPRVAQPAQPMASPATGQPQRRRRATTKRRRTSIPATATRASAAALGANGKPSKPAGGRKKQTPPRVRAQVKQEPLAPLDPSDRFLIPGD